MNKPWQRIPMVALMNQARLLLPNLAHRVVKGKFDLVEVLYCKSGASAVKVVGEPLPLHEHEERLRGIIKDFGIAPCA